MVKKWQDPLVEEVRERGRQYTARLGNDIHRIMEDLRKHKEEFPERYVSRASILSRKLEKSNR